eukprot:scaffold10944_cov28-Tisochrysis_lutea.AAC.1
MAAKRAAGTLRRAARGEQKAATKGGMARTRARVSAFGSWACHSAIPSCAQLGACAIASAGRSRGAGGRSRMLARAHSGAEDSGVAGRE